ncbi:MAG: 4'-phosphopantetheinyl transferase superfamily protein [Candidatus Aminicenantes bacterium]|nr:4'-phosphopantetheinyl transferase superfamily protein [Candidatus Aminicenantes bacterium]
MVEVYAVKLSENVAGETVERLLPFVAPDKQARIRRFYKWMDSLRSLFADLLIRHIIIHKTNLKNADITFSTNAYGKPSLNFPGDLHFNLSHSGDWVVCAVDAAPVGIDVEQISPVDLDISKNYFSPDEHADLMSKDDKIAYFFTLWTLKESYIKIVGKGLSMPLNSFSIRFIENNEIRIAAEKKVLQDIFFCRYDIDSKYKMAACASNKNLSRSPIFKTIDELVESFLMRYET